MSKNPTDNSLKNVMRPVQSAIDGIDRPRAFGPPEPFEQVLKQIDDPVPETSLGLEAMHSLWEAAEWLAMAPYPKARAIGRDLAQWVKDGEGVSLQKWLGLSEGGRASARDAHRIAERNAALRYVARLPPYADLSATAAARLIVTRWTRWGAARHERDAEGQTFALLDRAGHKVLHAETIRKIITREA